MSEKLTQILIFRFLMDLIILSLAVGMGDWLITSLCELIHTIWFHSVVTLQKSRPRSMDFFYFNYRIILLTTFKWKQIQLVKVDFILLLSQTMGGRLWRAILTTMGNNNCLEDAHWVIRQLLVCTTLFLIGFAVRFYSLLTIWF